jgi:hypothetical protein
MRGLTLVVLLAAAGCQTYRDDLARSQRAFEQNEHERALALLRELEPGTLHLSATDQAEYAYLRGMTDYRIGYKVDARHWLALAKSMDDQAAGVLPQDWKARMGDALKELNEAVYAGGSEPPSSATQKPRGVEGSTKPEKPENDP